jgi:hypothetical protein
MGGPTAFCDALFSAVRFERSWCEKSYPWCNNPVRKLLTTIDGKNCKDLTAMNSGSMDRIQVLDRVVTGLDCLLVWGVSYPLRI